MPCDLLMPERGHCQTCDEWFRAAAAKEKHFGLAERVAEILRRDLRLVAIDGEPCHQCGETVDYSFKVKDGCIGTCATAIAELVFGAIADGNIDAVKSSATNK